MDGKKTIGIEFDEPLNEIYIKLTEIESLLSTVEEEPEKSSELLKRCHDLKGRYQLLLKNRFEHLTPWQRVLMARHPARPEISDYLTYLFEEVLPLHGDRCFSDDQAMVTALAKIGKYRVLVVGHSKGKTTPERIESKFGMAHPEGYRKALRKMKLAEKLKLPILTFINTPGANPDIEAEERGQSQAIAQNLCEMARLAVPILSVVIGEGGSGGALGIGVADRLMMFENSYYSVISPEGCAAILWKSGANEYKMQAAEALKLTANDLKALGVLDRIIPEPLGGAHRDPHETVQILKAVLLEELEKVFPFSKETLLAQRYQKIRKYGYF
jgi:acetyl-CoA carboxylase carboxyl transferase subunit alpha